MQKSGHPQGMADIIIDFCNCLFVGFKDADSHAIP